MSEYRYLFGTPLSPRPPSSKHPRDTFILGAYPSAIHVTWMPIQLRPIAAVAVADEPEPFWEGQDEDDQVLKWQQSIAWNPAWGKVRPAGRFNGSSGAWLREKVMETLGLHRSATWITDCLDSYHESKGAAARLESPDLLAYIARNHIPNRHLPSHPTENRIVEAADYQRLSQELKVCQPKQIITLGNAALRVFNALLERPIALTKLSPDRDYGRPYLVQTKFDLQLEWIPLAHPAAPPAYQEAHARWKASIHQSARQTI